MDRLSFVVTVYPHELHKSEVLALILHPSYEKPLPSPAAALLFLQPFLAAVCGALTGCMPIGSPNDNEWRNGSAIVKANSIDPACPKALPNERDVPAYPASICYSHSRCTFPRPRSFEHDRFI
jgi:hypothetical protein